MQCRFLAGLNNAPTFLIIKIIWCFKKQNKAENLSYRARMRNPQYLPRGPNYAVFRRILRGGGGWFGGIVSTNNNWSINEPYYHGCEYITDSMNVFDAFVHTKCFLQVWLQQYIIVITISWIRRDVHLIGQATHSAISLKRIAIAEQPNHHPMSNIWIALLVLFCL